MYSVTSHMGKLLLLLISIIDNDNNHNEHNTNNNNTTTTTTTTTTNNNNSGGHKNNRLVKPYEVLAHPQLALKRCCEPLLWYPLALVQTWDGRPVRLKFTNSKLIVRLTR